MFQEFLDGLGSLKHKPVALKQVKKILKIEEKSLPKNITNYFVEFTKHTSHKWQRKDKMIFIWTTLKYLEKQGRTDLKPNDDDWIALSEILGAPPELLNSKWIGMLKTDLKQSPWTPEEDDLLRKVMTQKFISWTHVALEYNRASPIMRHAKQVRERWNNYLDPDLNKCPWTESEQIQLLQLVQNQGKKWSVISKQIKGRTENQVKNAYNSLINSYRRNHMQTLDSDEIIVSKLLSKLDPPLLQANASTPMIQPMPTLQQQLLMQALLIERLKSMAFFAQLPGFLAAQQQQS
ncbi:unnamed protein product [Paramecium primaurelia]|uniref:Uncharacterized protein n=2 Tax=Paramecium TaxID=5884 RepID=A0A8S1V4I5_9CILI|nr:unnamed protein product [Paramecium primaurelia]CAD8171785.1 unnamed protein product [Paramecium pentaurelia]